MALRKFDITNLEIGLWKIIRRAPEKGRDHWEAICKCGKISFITRCSLYRKNPSRGCKKCRNIKTALKHGLSQGPECRAWKAMHHRCLNPQHKSYKNYGGRGITIAKEWIRGASGLINFYNHIGPRPPGTSLDRIDNNKGYIPGNVRWATWEEQARNRRSSKNIFYLGENHPIVEACKLAKFDVSGFLKYRKKNTFENLQQAWEIYHKYRDLKFIRNNLQ